MGRGCCLDPETAGKLRAGGGAWAHRPPDSGRGQPAPRGCGPGHGSQTSGLQNRGKYIFVVLGHPHRGNLCGRPRKPIQWGFQALHLSRRHPRCAGTLPLAATEQPARSARCAHVGGWPHGASAGRWKGWHCPLGAFTARGGPTAFGPHSSRGREPPGPAPPPAPHDAPGAVRPGLVPACTRTPPSDRSSSRPVRSQAPPHTSRAAGVGRVASGLMVAKKVVAWNT